MDNNSIVAGFDEGEDEKLKVELEILGISEACLLIRLSGYVDTYNATSFQRRVNKAIDAGYVRIIFDLSSLSYVSSTGINSFIAFLRSTQQRGGDIVLLGIQTEVCGVFEVLGFAAFFKMATSLPGALSQLSLPPLPL
jgi:anti-anti-sigma factor